MASIRKPTILEEKLIKFLIQKASLDVSETWSESLLVQPMDDGGMGSLLFFYEGKIEENRIFGKQISEVKFSDVDGIAVIASLNVDNEGKLFELDIWKTDFSQLSAFPYISQLV